MTTLVTGATGFIGSHLARQLAERGDRVRVLVRQRSSLANLQGVEVEAVRGDLLEPESLRALLRGCRKVFHVAADYRLWARHPDEMYRTNVMGTRHLLQLAFEEGVETFVYTSSVATIAPPRDGEVSNEESLATLARMIGPYKRSKFLAEQEALAMARKGLPVIIVNPTAPVGPGDIKPTPTGKMILDFLNRRMPAYVDTGLNWVAVEDVAAGHLLAADRGRVGERYILGHRNLTMKQILDALEKLTGLPAPRVRLPHAVAMAAGYAENFLSCWLLRRPPRIPLDGVRMSKYKMFVDCSKAMRELGYAPTPVEDALARAVAWFCDAGYVRGSSSPQWRRAA
ncbi:MAG TPA: hopanoid-associated sugar epimerase [Candidatus Acidoferrales bacterium]